MKSPLTLLALAFLLTACGDSSTDEVSTLPPVGVLDTGDYFVTLHSSEDGPVYSVANKEGEVLASHLNRQEFAAQFPQTYEDISTLWAGNLRRELKSAPGAPQTIEVLPFESLPNR